MESASPSPVTIQTDSSGRVALRPVAIAGGPAVNRVEAVGVDVVREPTRAADSGDEGESLSRDAELGQDLLDLRQDGVVAATRTPADVLVGDEVLLARLLVGCTGYTHGCSSVTLSSSVVPFRSRRQRLTISETLKGRPWILLKPTASTRYSARISRTSWPRFISGTSTVR